MQTTEWLAYFEMNAHRPSPATPAAVNALPAGVHGPLVHALQCFQLGEAGEGRVAGEAARSDDPALDEALKTSVALYVREEGRHATELARLLRAMGAPLLRKHASAWLFERSRRMMGLRTKMAVIAVAEVVGSTFYATLAERAPCPHVAEVARVIGIDEEHHLDFQRDYFSRVLAVTPAWLRPVLAVLLWTWFLSVLAGAIASVALGHRRLFVALGLGPVTFAGHCVRRLWRLLRTGHEARPGQSSSGYVARPAGPRRFDDIF